ncbi:MAG: UrcA family protein [Alphaproteobacteria bacterium]|nr:UrcA family protein [Alphaproteobacteria bacterium]MBV9372364.1 UrcA family protein [Alphaproteobacteria bacterium]MBV9899656.1 UrcA family protein [Alphaproteobacteria bacterium]
MKTLFASIALATVLAASAGSAARAQPAGGEETYTASIRSGDLNLATPGGLATFHGRVKAAANQVCGTAPVLPFNEASAIAACRAQLFRAADRQVSLAMAKPDTLVAGTR